MNRANEIHWGVLEMRGLAVVSAYGLGGDWCSPAKKAAPVMNTDAETAQVTTQDTQEHLDPLVQAENLKERVQDFEKSDLAVRRPPAGASALAMEAIMEEAGLAA